MVHTLTALVDSTRQMWMTGATGI